MSQLRFGRPAVMPIEMTNAKTSHFALGAI